MKSIFVKGLFGKFDYNIIFKEDRLTILTGPNGYGKSTILRIINNLSKGVQGFIRLMSTNFSSIKLCFDDKTYEITRTKDRFEINGKDIKKSIQRIAEDLIGSRLYRDIDDELMYFRKDDSYLKSYNIIQLLSAKLEDVSLEDVKLLDYGERILSKNKDVYGLITEIKEKIGEIYFIKEQRLIQPQKKTEKNRIKREIVEVITEIPVKLREKILDVAASYSQISTQLDSSYPSRLLRNQTIITEEEFILKNEETKTKYNKLREYDLTPEQPIDEMNYKEEFSKALSVYFDDFKNKYSVFEPLVNQLDIYTDIINNRLSFKKIQIKKDIGLSVVNDKGENIELSQLSSGEQQEIVLFYELIFEASKGCWLLIDEPEISLHIAWQRMFTHDLIKVSDYKKFHIIIATHSPQIIDNRWNNQIDLGELFDEFNNIKIGRASCRERV